MRQVNRSWLKAFATKLADDIRKPLAGRADVFSPSKFRMKQSTTGGWWLVFGRLRRPKNVTLELWLDKYADTKAHRIYYGVGANSSKPIRTLAKRAGAVFGAPVVKADEDLHDDELFTRLAAPLARASYSRPLRSHHDVHGYGFYEWHIPPFSARLELEVLAKVAFFFARVVGTSGKEKGRTSKGSFNARAPRGERLLAAAEVAAGGQGLVVDPRVRSAIEAHSMARAKLYFGVDFEVEDVSKTKPYDLLCTRRSQRLRVEVKGTSTNGESIFLTANERSLALAAHHDYGLYVLRNIVLTQHEGVVQVSGGDEKAVVPWEPEDADFLPVLFRVSI